MASLDRGHPACCCCMSIFTATRLVAVCATILSILTFNIVGIIFCIFLLVAVFAVYSPPGYVLAFLVYVVGNLSDICTWVYTVHLAISAIWLIFGIVIVTNADDWADRNPYGFCSDAFTSYDDHHHNTYHGDSCALDTYRTLGTVIIVMAAVSLIVAAWFGCIVLIYYRNSTPDAYVMPQQAVYVIPPGQPSFGQPGIVQYASTYQPQPYYAVQGQQPQQPQQSRYTPTTLAPSHESTKSIRF